MIRCLEKINIPILFSLEKHVSLDTFKELSKNIKNKEIIVNILNPSVYNNIYYAINHLLTKFKNNSLKDSEEYFEYGGTAGNQSSHVWC